MSHNISAILLAAGLSSRMGTPKPLLPWGQTTILGQVVSTFAAAGLQEIVVITGGARAEVENLVKSLAQALPVRTVYNPGYLDGGMLSSIQAGLAALGTQVDAALVGLGDQPQVKQETVLRICESFRREQQPLVVPSYQNHRGHPWLVARGFWPALHALTTPATPRDFLSAHASQVTYVPADASVLQDLDTPEEYARQKP